MLENCKKVPITFQMHIYLLNTLQIKESLLLEKKNITYLLIQEKKIISVDNTHNKNKQYTLSLFFFSKPHNNSGNLSAGSILSTQLTHKLAHTAWYCRPPYVSLAHCSSLAKSWQVAFTSSKQTPHARNWATWSSDFRMPFLKSRSLSSGCNVFTNTFSYWFVFLKTNIALPLNTNT